MRMELSGQNLVWRYKVVPIKLEHIQFSCSVESNSLWPHGRQGPSWRSMPGLPVHHQFLELTQTHVHRVGDAIQPSHPLLSPSSTFNLAQNQGLFQWVSSSNQVVKVWSFSFSISPSNEYSGSISFRIDSFDHLAVRGNLKSLLLQHSHNSCSEVSNCFLPGDFL